MKKRCPPAPSNMNKAVWWSWEESSQERDERWECCLEFVGPGRESLFLRRCRYFIWSHEAEIRWQGGNCTKFLQWPKNRETVKVKQNSRRWSPGDHSVTNVCYVCINKDFAFMLCPQKSWPLWSALVILVVRYIVVRYIDGIPRACWPGGLASLESPGSHWETRLEK